MKNRFEWITLHVDGSMATKVAFVPGGLLFVVSNPDGKALQFIPVDDDEKFEWFSKNT